MAFATAFAMAEVLAPQTPAPDKLMLGKPEFSHPVPDDRDAREAALDTTRSLLVQAPAGAGKTNLLTQRYLALLAEVEEPEQILAITFTRAATAEMRHRILKALNEAAEAEAAEAAGRESPGEHALARAALRHARLRGWRLLDQPHRLDVQTIDSLCLRLAHGQPLLARLGGALQPTEDARALYAAAARRTVALLGSTRPELDDALRTLLLRRDNNLIEVESLLAGMLARRDAWLGVLPLGGSANGAEVDWDTVRGELEQPFADEHSRVLGSLEAAFEAMPELAAELLELAAHAASNRADSDKKGLQLDLLQNLEELPEDRETWLALASLLLKQDGGWRGRWTVAEGFPTDGKGSERNEKERLLQWKRRMEACCANLRAQESGGARLQRGLHGLRGLPPQGYTDDQWHTLLAVFRVLRRAAGELRLVFAESNAVDFIEIAQAAGQVLRDEGSARGLLESEGTRHLLIDEFQDTSRAQYRLIAHLLREWSQGDGRTVFLVGDPLQSIYGFRQAEVALFHETRAHGLPCGDDLDPDRRHACHPLQLRHNFRSHSGLVEELNTRFAAMFAGGRDDTFVPAAAWPQAGVEHPYSLHPFFINAATNADANTDDSPAQARLKEAAEVVRVLQGEQPRIAAAEARGSGEYRVAVLVRSRSHLSAILPALRAAGIPYRAVDLEPLANQPEVHDLWQLLRALLHADERNSWLTVLRAPWCGLLLRDLHLLAGDDDLALLARPLPELARTRLHLLSPDGQARLSRTLGILEEALRTRYSDANVLSLSRWLERTWTALGGPACVDQTAHENTAAFFRLLDEVPPDGTDIFRGDFAQRLERLCAAPDTRVSERFGVQLMTVHKAKGLGFEVVLLPGLERKTGQDRAELLALLQRPRLDTTSGGTLKGETLEDETLLAPVSSKEDTKHADGDADGSAAYDWVKKQRGARERDERRRLFYVACTRARTRLHLFATIAVKDGKLGTPTDGSLLAAAWPALGPELEACLQSGTSAEGLALAAAAADSATMQTMQITQTMQTMQTMQITQTMQTMQTMQTIQTIDRLPPSWLPPACAPDVIVPMGAPGAAAPLFTRSEGSLAARARGTAMHALLEQLAILHARTPGPSGADSWRAGLQSIAARTLREAGLTSAQVSAATPGIVGHALAVAADATGSWLLRPHPQAYTERSWHWDDAGTLRSLRVDRSFLAGEQPGTEGDYLWVIDYKTGSHAESFQDDTGRQEWLAAQQAQWQPQLEAYGNALLAALPQPKPLRYGLFFPELLHLRWWSPDAGS